MHYLFKIQLRGIEKPTVCRLVDVPDGITFMQFHEIIQFIFPWQRRHVWQFSPCGYGTAPIVAPSDSANGFDFAAEATRVSDLFKRCGDKMVYTYDFGSNWIHDIVLKDITDDSAADFFTLVRARGAVPPEDCGGVRGFEHFKEVMSDPHGAEYAKMCRMVGMFPDEDYWSPRKADIDAGRYKLPR